MLNVCDKHVLHIVETYGFSKKSTPYVLHMMHTHVFHMGTHITYVLHMVGNSVSPRKGHCMLYLWYRHIFFITNVILWSRAWFP
jgi:hypothetical protein